MHYVFGTLSSVRFFRYRMYSLKKLISFYYIEQSNFPTRYSCTISFEMQFLQVWRIEILLRTIIIIRFYQCELIIQC